MGLFTTLWTKSDLMASSDAQTWKEIESAEKECVPFSLSFREVDDRWGIWLEVVDEFLLVDPISLTSSLFKDDSYYDLVSKPDIKEGHFIVDVRREDYVWTWVLRHSMLTIKGHQSYKIDDYVSSIANALDALDAAIHDQKQIVYDVKEISAERVRICKEQVHLFSHLGSHVRVRSEQIHVEEMHFEPVDGEGGEKYAIHIGSRGYETWYTHWDNNPEYIRHQLESIAFYGRDTVVDLSFDMSDTTIRLKKVNVLKKMKEEGEGVGFEYDDLMLVTIEPNEFVTMPIIRGYCDRDQSIRALYQGLLRLALDCPIKEDKYDDYPSRMIQYNRFKSPIIENSLEGIEEKVQTRQVIVKHILTICPDINQLMIDEEGVSWELNDDGLIFEAYDKDGKQIVFPEIRSWCKEIEPIVIASETGEEYQKDWDDYHKRGIELAHQLREKLSDDFDLWYEAPYEDKSGTVPQPILIMHTKQGDS